MNVQNIMRNDTAIMEAITENIIENLLGDDIRENVKTMEFVDWLVDAIFRSNDVEFAAETAVTFLERMSSDVERHGALTFELTQIGVQKPIFRRVLICPDENRILDTFREMWEATPTIVPSIGIMSDSDRIVFWSGGNDYEFKVLGGIR